AQRIGVWPIGRGRHARRPRRLRLASTRDAAHSFEVRAKRSERRRAERCYKLGLRAKRGRAKRAGEWAPRRALPVEGEGTEAPRFNRAGAGGRTGGEPVGLAVAGASSRAAQRRRGGLTRGVRR